MADGFAWESPPVKLTGRADVAAKLAKRIASRPNEWARIAIYNEYAAAHQRASTIRTGKVQAFSDIGRFEAEVREIPEGYGVWVRCVYVNKKVRAHLGGGSAE